MSDVLSQDPISPQSSWFHRAYNNELDINFHKWWKRGAMVSLALVLIFGASLLVRGLNLGIEFEGGLVWEVEADLGAGEVRDAMADIGFGDAIIQTGDGTVQVRAEVAADDATVGAEVARTLAELAGTSADNVSFNDISASWGDDVTNKAETALVVFLIAISFYLSFRTEWRMADGALAALERVGRCVAWVPPPSTSTAATSRPTRPSIDASRPCTSRSRHRNTRSRSSSACAPVCRTITRSRSTMAPCARPST